MSVTTETTGDRPHHVRAESAAITARGSASTGSRATVPSASAAARIAHIEVIRGLACLMVVAYHVIGNDPAHGMRMAEGTTWWAVPRLFDAVQMPLFAFVSGWVFTIATDDLGRFRAGLAKKLLRLALPMASVSLIYLALATATGKGEGRGVLDVLILPYQHLWYLQASLWLVAFAAAGSLVFAGRRGLFAGIGLAVTLAVFLVVPRFGINLLAIEQAIYLAPYFFAGLVLRTSDAETLVLASRARTGAVLGWLTAVGGAAAVLTVLVFHASGPSDTPMQTAPAFVAATALAGLMMLMRPRSSLLEAIGARSFTIYLFHVFFAAPMREVVLKIWPGVPSLVLFSIVFTVGVGVPFVLHGFITKNRWSALLLLGETGGRR